MNFSSKSRKFKKCSPMSRESLVDEHTVEMFQSVWLVFGEQVEIKCDVQTKVEKQVLT